MDNFFIAQNGSLQSQTQSKLLRGMAHVFSYLFHPLLIILYMAAYMIFFHRIAFLGLDIRFKIFKFLSVVVNAFFFPLISLALMRGLGFVKSFLLPTAQDRIVPYVATNIFLFWNFYVTLNDTVVPDIYKAMMLGIFLASCAALFLNNYFKISMHSIGAGGFSAYMLLLIYYAKTETALPASMALLISGIICTSRLIVSNHSQKEIYIGFITGCMSQVIAFVILVA